MTKEEQVSDSRSVKAPQDPYQPEFYSLTPTPIVKFFRVFWPWQIFRFFIINLKMVNMIKKSHGYKEDS